MAADCIEFVVGVGDVQNDFLVDPSKYRKEESSSHPRQAQRPPIHRSQNKKSRQI